MRIPVPASSGGELRVHISEPSNPRSMSRPRSIDPKLKPAEGNHAGTRPCRHPEPTGNAEAEAGAEMVVAPGKLTSGGLDHTSVMARSAEIAPVGRVEESEDVGNRCRNRSIGCNMAIMVCQPERQRFPGKQAVGLPVLETHRIQVQPHGTAQRRRPVLKPCQSKLRVSRSFLSPLPTQRIFARKRKFEGHSGGGLH